MGISFNISIYQMPDTTWAWATLGTIRDSYDTLFDALDDCRRFCIKEMQKEEVRKYLGETK